MIIYPRWFPVAGLTIAPWLVFIKAVYKNNIQLLTHENVHISQMEAHGVLTFWFRYLFSRKWRQQYEVEAYKVQIVHGGSLGVCADHLSRMYFLDLTYDDALLLLK